MSRRRAAAVVPALVLAALVGPLGAPSSASTCAAVAEPPHLVPEEYGIRATGTFGCADASTGMTITVCIQEQYAVTGGWFDRDCATTTAAGATRTVTGEAVTDVMVYSTFLRATVLATNDAGDTAGGKSAPVFWFNCACYVG